MGPATINTPLIVENTLDNVYRIYYITDFGYFSSDRVKIIDYNCGCVYVYVYGPQQPPHPVSRAKKMVEK